ncbi:MAG: diguanylate cyclase [Ignavibacteria bacterium RBG_13_36_8]|nr:MAG: diguanylate cyclase [Ignavibacteria bacterium RBG_13_36_8]
MGINRKNRRRILIFLVIPLLTAVQFFTEDLILKIIASILLVVYVGFIIFLRDSIREEYFDDIEERLSPEDDSEAESSGKREIVAEDDDFKILTPIDKIEVKKTEESHRSRYETKDFFKPPDLKANFEKIVSEELPADFNHDEQFGFALEKILTVIKEAFLAHSALFFWYNKKKQKLTLEKYVSSSSEISERKYDIEDDVLSKIVQKEEPELLTNILPNAEKDVIRYYVMPQGIRSFVGVPLYYRKRLLGVLALDSKEGDAFGIETIYSLGRSVRVISIMISLFEEKFSESQAEQRLKSLLTILGGDKKFTTETELYEALEASVRNLIPWDAFAFISYMPTEQRFKISRVVNKTSLKYTGENLEVELNDTLVGKAIISGEPRKVDDTSAVEQKRYSKAEDVSFDGSFLAIPLVYDDQNFGVICFESLKKNIYTNADIEFLRNAMKIFAFILYSFSSHSLLRSLLSVDIDTLALNKKSFMERITADLIKSEELSLHGAVALIYIDDFLEQESLFEGDPFPKVLKSIAAAIKEEMTPLNIFGRLGERLFAVYFFNSTAKDVFLWAEKLRTKIARKPIAVVSKQTTFTVSIGVAATGHTSDAEEVISNAELALNKALEKGGNTVKSIN